jgi:sugar lactone lactonase YvrE
MPIVAIKRLDVDSGRISIVRAEANVANGMTLDPDGCLLVCEQGTMSQPARISRLDCIDGHLVVEAAAREDGDGLVEHARKVVHTPVTHERERFKAFRCVDVLERADC